MLRHWHVEFLTFTRLAIDDGLLVVFSLSPSLRFSAKAGARVCVYEFCWKINGKYHKLLMLKYLAWQHSECLIGSMVCISFAYSKGVTYLATGIDSTDIGSSCISLAMHNFINFLFFKTFTKDMKQQFVLNFRAFCIFPAKCSHCEIQSVVFSSLIHQYIKFYCNYLTKNHKNWQRNWLSRFVCVSSS